MEPTSNPQPNAPFQGPPDFKKVCVRLCDVHKRFGQLVVLNGLNLDIERGKTTVIIGPSGTGKSVLLKHIVGLLHPDKGDVWFDGIRVNAHTDTELVESRKKIGFLFQLAALFDSMNVRDNICFPLMQHTRMTRAEQDERCAEVLRMVGLSGVEKKMPGDLSGGQKKRVALARAVVLAPELILYDEPTTGLDPIRSDVINELIISLARNLGVTSIVVTHDMASADKIADRIVMLNQGKIVADGKLADFHRSTEPIVQHFVQGKAEEEDLAQIRAGFSGKTEGSSD